MKKSKKPVAIKCGTCPNPIYKEKELQGKVWFENGKPICVVCRLKTSHSFVKIGKKKFQNDVNDRESFKQEKANEEIKEVAIASQEKHEEARIIKNKS